MLNILTYRTMRIVAAALLTACALSTYCVADAVSGKRIVVEISGGFSSDPSAIRVNGTPGPFPIPALLGGSFSGQFEYDPNTVGVLEPNNISRLFPISTIHIDIRNNLGQLVHTIEHAPNPFRVSNGRAEFAMGPSFHTQLGHAPNTPTDIRFDLLSAGFTLGSPRAKNTPPDPAVLNGATFGSVVGFGPLIELDSAANPFHGWDLPITSIALYAREVPEPGTTVVFGPLAIVAGTCLRLRRQPSKRCI